MLEQVKLSNDLDSLFVLSQCPLGPVYMKVGDPK